MKIAVLGSHPKTKMQAPFDDDSWSIWACSPHNYRHPEWGKIFGDNLPEGFPDGRLPRVDEWFEVHEPAGHVTRPPDYLDYVRELSADIPVWMRDRTNHPQAHAYPDEEMKRMFSPFAFTSSIAYIWAKAIHAAPQAIGMWGVMQASKTEHEQQRDGIRYFMWEAHRRGIEIVLPEEASHLFDMPGNSW